ALDAAGLKVYLTKVANDQFSALLPKDESGLAEYRRVVGTAARIMLDSGVPNPEEITGASSLEQSTLAGNRLYRLALTRRDAGEQIPSVSLIPPNFTGDTVLWIDGAGKEHFFDAE